MNLLEQFDGEELLALSRHDIDSGRLDKALAKLKRAHNQSDCPSIVLSTLARLYAQLKLFDKAKPLYQKYLNIEPGAMAELFQFGLVHYEMGEFQNALTIWQELLKEQPTHPPALYYCGLTKWQSGDHEGAKRDLSVLMQSAAVDNLYFTKAKELLGVINKQHNVEPEKGPSDTSTADLYKIEH